MSLETSHSQDDSVVDLARETDFRLGALCVNPAAREVARDGKRELLEPRVMQVLVALYRAQGAVVSRDALIARCWEGRIVGEDAINRAIWRLRKLAEADGDFAIETIPRVGYRLRVMAEAGVAAVLPAAEAEEIAPPDNPATKNLPQWWSRRLITGLSVLVLVMSALAAWLLWPATRSPAISVAVLPFVNLSGDASQEFFSDGITEEITSALAKIPKLPVVGRTSAFQYKGKAADLRAIGRALNASYLLEGSVRKANDRIRITAQLVSTDTGDHIWTDSYDRQLKDIFAVQEDVAQAIAGALQIPLGLGPGKTLVSSRTTNIDSYQNFLRARAFYRARQIDHAIPILEKAVADDPSYAPGWALLAQVYGLAPGVLNDGSVEQERIRIRPYADKAERAARQALRLDPRNAAAHAALAGLASSGLDWVTADDQYRQALALDPDDPDILHAYASGFLMNLGYLTQGMSIREKLRSLEPFVPIYNIDTASALMDLGKTDAAIDLLRAVPSEGQSANRRNATLALALADAGRYGEAADALQAMRPNPAQSREAIEYIARIMRSRHTPAPLGPLPGLGAFGFVYALTDVPGRALEIAERQVAVDGSLKPALSQTWNPIFASLRKTERFKALIREARLVDYWRAHGWPDLCHPVGTDDFACN